MNDLPNLPKDAALSQTAGVPDRKTLFEQAEVLAACYRLKELVEGVGCERWQNANGFRLKDTQQWVEFYNVVSRMQRLEYPPAAAPAASGGEYPECSGDPASCPENEGHGCCKPNPKCSCPSGDGSLDWPCKAHPPAASGGVDDRSGWCRSDGCVHKAFGEPIWKTGDNPFHSSPHPDALPDGTLSKSTVKRVTALAGASVSERARTALIGMMQSMAAIVSVRQTDEQSAADVIPREPVMTEIVRLRRHWDELSALEQALTQQRGDGDAVDRDAWAEALELPQGYTVEEFLPGGWHYAWTRADGERMVSGTTWNHPALAAIAAWQYAPATIPQPSADAARDDRCRHENGSPGYDHWRCHDCGAFKTDSGWGVASHRYFNKRSEAEFYKKHGRLPEHASTQPWGNGNTMTTDELESLLGRGRDD